MKAIRDQITLKKWIDNPPTILIYRPDGTPSLDQLPDMVTPDAVVCFFTMQEAKSFLSFPGGWRFRIKNLSVGEWLHVIRGEMAQRRTHLSVFHLPGDGTMSKIGVLIEDILMGFETAAAVGRVAPDGQHRLKSSRN